MAVHCAGASSWRGLHPGKEAEPLQIYCRSRARPRRRPPRREWRGCKSAAETAWASSADPFRRIFGGTEPPVNLLQKQAHFARPPKIPGARSGDAVNAEHAAVAEGSAAAPERSRAHRALTQPRENRGHGPDLRHPALPACPDLYTAAPTPRADSRVSPASLTSTPAGNSQLAIVGFTAAVAVPAG